MDRVVCHSMGVLLAITLSGCSFGNLGGEREGAAPRPRTEVGVVVPTPPAVAPEETATPSPQPRPSSPSVEPTIVITPILPTPAPARQDGAIAESRLSNMVRFSEDAYLPDAGSEALLRAHAEQLKADRSRRLLLKGHGDGHGSVHYNQALAAKRAEMVAKALRGYGVAAQQLTEIAIGDDGPNAPEVRRVVLIYR